jgi:hypothetical protein
MTNQRSDGPKPESMILKATESTYDGWTEGALSDSEGRRGGLAILGPS